MTKEEIYTCYASAALQGIVARTREISLNMMLDPAGVDVKKTMTNSAHQFAEAMMEWHEIAEEEKCLRRKEIAEDYNED